MNDTMIKANQNNKELTLDLPNGDKMDAVILTFPIEFGYQETLINLWRTEWDSTDFDWLSAMNGDFSDSLTIKTVIGYKDGQPAGTASVYYPKENGEVALLGNVLTHPNFRKMGIGKILSQVIVEHAFAAGCKLCYLGTSHSQAVYEKIGFRTVNGSVMRLANDGFDDYERYIYAVGQKTDLRDSRWGDMPGVACLAAQTLSDITIDYSRGLFSRSVCEMKRCVSSFSSIWYDVKEHSGVMGVLTGENSSRILGFCSLTPGPAPMRDHVATIEFATHPNYDSLSKNLLEWLIQKAQERRVSLLQAFLHQEDCHKYEILHKADFVKFTEFPNYVKNDNDAYTVSLLQREV